MLAEKITANGTAPTLCNGVEDLAGCLTEYSSKCSDVVVGEAVRRNCPGMCGTCTSVAANTEGAPTNTTPGTLAGQEDQADDADSGTDADPVFIVVCVCALLGLTLAAVLALIYYTRQKTGVRQPNGVGMTFANGAFLAPPHLDGDMHDELAPAAASVAYEDMGVLPSGAAPQALYLAPGEQAFPQMAATATPGSGPVAPAGASGQAPGKPAAGSGGDGAFVDVGAGLDSFKGLPAQSGWSMNWFTGIGRWFCCAHGRGRFNAANAVWRKHLLQSRVVCVLHVRVYVCGCVGEQRAVIS